MERSKLDDKNFEVGADTAKEYRRRIERKLNGSELLDKSLIFYKILTKLEHAPMSRNMLISAIDSHSEECISLNLALLEKSRLIEKGSQDYKLSISAKKLLIKLK